MRCPNNKPLARCTVSLLSVHQLLARAYVCLIDQYGQVHAACAPAAPYLRSAHGPHAVGRQHRHARHTPPHRRRPARYWLPRAWATQLTTLLRCQNASASKPRARVRHAARTKGARARHADHGRPPRGASASPGPGGRHARAGGRVGEARTAGGVRTIQLALFVSMCACCCCLVPAALPTMHTARLCTSRRATV